MFSKLDAVEDTEFKAEYSMAFFVVWAQLVLKFGIVITVLAGGTCFWTVASPVHVHHVPDHDLQAVQPAEQLPPFIITMINVKYDMERLQKIEDQSVQEGTTEFEPESYNIVFDRIGFFYDDRTLVLRGVSFTAKECEVTTLIGPLWEGKMTAAKLATRF